MFEEHNEGFVWGDVKRVHNFERRAVMNQESRKAEIERMLDQVEDEKLKAQIIKGLKYLDDPARHLHVTYGISMSRAGGYEELALKFAQLAYEQNPEDCYFLLELCSSLRQPQEVVDAIEQFLGRVELHSLPKDQQAKMTVTLATGYREIGKVSESIKTLEESRGELARGTEILAELYYETGCPQKAIDLLFERLKYMGKLSDDMASCMGKSFDALDNYSEAVGMLAKFKDDEPIKSLHEKMEGKLRR